MGMYLQDTQLSNWKENYCWKEIVQKEEYNVQKFEICKDREEGKEKEEMAGGREKNEGE